MKRLVLCALVLLSASMFGCQTTGGGSTPGFDWTKTREIAVKDSARADPSVAEIKAGVTPVVWTAPGSVEALWIAFKPDPLGVPPNPDCQGRTCTFPATSSVGFDYRTFSYSVAVKKNGVWKTRDPKLIIKP